MLFQDAFLHKIASGQLAIVAVQPVDEADISQADLKKAGYKLSPRGADLLKRWP